MRLAGDEIWTPRGSLCPTQRFRAHGPPAPGGDVEEDDARGHAAARPTDAPGQGGTPVPAA